MLLLVRINIGVCFLILTGCGRVSPSARIPALPSSTTLPSPILAASPEPLIVIYNDLFESPAVPPRKTVEIAVWGDGRIVWRASDALHQARIETSRIEQLLQQLQREGVFGDGNVEYNSFGPDSSFDVIDIRLPDRKLILRSWHENYTNSGLVVTSRGVEVLEGRNAETIMAAEPAEYHRFRKIWAEIRDTVKSWRPANGDPFSGSIPIQDQ